MCAWEATQNGFSNQFANKFLKPFWNFAGKLADGSASLTKRYFPVVKWWGFCCRVDNSPVRWYLLLGWQQSRNHTFVTLFAAARIFRLKTTLKLLSGRKGAARTVRTRLQRFVRIPTTLIGLSWCALNVSEVYHDQAEQSVG